MGVLRDVPVEGMQEGVLVIWPVWLGRAGNAGPVHPSCKGLGTLYQAAHQPPQHPLDLIQAGLHSDLWSAQRQRHLQQGHS